MLIDILARIGRLLVCQPSQIIHACVQCYRNTLALFKGKMPGTTLDLRIIALVNPSQHLHLDLRVALLFSEVPQARHSITRDYYANLTY